MARVSLGLPVLSSLACPPRTIPACCVGDAPWGSDSPGEAMRSLRTKESAGLTGISDTVERLRVLAGRWPNTL